MSLRVGIDKKDALSMEREGSSDVNCCCCFTDPAFLICNCDDHVASKIINHTIIKARQKSNNKDLFKMSAGRHVI